MAEPRPKKRKPISEEESGGDTFIVMFTALMMILLAFFILLSTLASVDERRKRLALGSLLGSFGILPHGTGTDSEGEYVPSSSPVLAGVQNQAVLKILGSMFDGSSAAGSVQVFERQGKVVLSFRSDIVFLEGSANVSPEAFGLLDQVALAIHSVGQPVGIGGHTDSAPGKNRLANWRLSVRRAISVLRYLRTGCRVSPALLSAAGYADTRPADDAPQATGPEHRRVEIVFNNALEVTGGKS